jgi:hypothetical protein
MANSKETVGVFCDIIYKDCLRRWGEDFTVKDLVYHLSENGLIPEKTLRNYMLFKDFDEFLIKNEGHIGYTFIDLSIKYDVSERQCRNIIYKHRYKFLRQTNIR